MIKPAALSLLAVALICTPACEQQDYSETKMFNQSNKVGGHGHGGGDHAKPAAGGAAEQHPEKKH